MARLTALFDIEDRMSRKLKRMTGDLKKVRQISEPPMVITASDRASKVVRKITRFVKADIAKTHDLVIFGRDLATNRVLRPISNFMQRRMPRTHDLMVRGIDRATPVVQRINRMTRGALLGSYMMTILARDAATPIINRVTQFAKASFNRGYSLSVRTLDLATNGLRNISNFARGSVGKTYYLTVRVADLATRPLRAIANTATSTLGLLGAAGGVYGGVVAPLNMVMDRQGTQTAFEVLLGSAEAAHDRVEELTKFAGGTPFARDDIFKSSRLLETFTGSALSTGEGLRLVGDVAAGTQTDFQETAMWFGRLYDSMKSGRPIGDATSRLQEMGAISGESRAKLEELAESGKDISEIWPQATEEFSKYNGMMEKLSDNLQNLLLGTKQFFVQNMFMKWGEGLEKALSPALSRFREWRGENAKSIAVMGEQFERLGEKAATAFLKPVEAIGAFAGTQFEILFPEDGDYSDMSFDARLNLVIDNTKDVFNDWWANTGKDQFANMGDKVGQAYGGLIKGAVSGLLGLETEEDINPFIDAGVTAGRGFVEGFLEALDPAQLSAGIAKKVAEINVNAGKSLWGHATGNEELANSGSIGAALVTDFLLLAGASKLITSVAPVGKMIGRSVKGIGKLRNWSAGKFNSGRNSGNPNGFGGGRGGNDNGGPRPPTSGSRGPEGDGSNRRPSFFNPNRPPNNPPSSGGGLLKGLKKIPLIGPAIAGISLATMSKDELPEGIGSMAGGLSGAAAGAAIGSIIPGVGTLIGGVVGGILGSLGGGAVGKWIGDLDFASIGSSISEGFSNSIIWIKGAWGSFSNWFSESVWSPIAEGSAKAGEWIQDKWSTFSEWFSSNVWSPIVDSASKTSLWISDTWNSSVEWIQDKWSAFSEWFSESVWKPVSKGFMFTIDIIIGLWDMAEEWIQDKWSSFAGWFSESVWNPVVQGATLAAGWLYLKFTEGWAWIQDKWSTFKDWFSESVWTPLVDAATESIEWVSTKFDEGLVWIQETWSTAKEWFQESVWTPLTEKATEVGAWLSAKFSEAWVWVQETWSIANAWFDETIWTPISEAAAIAGAWVSTKFSEAWTGIQDIWGTVTAWFDETIWLPLVEAVDRTKNAFQENFEEAKEFVSEVWSPVADWFTETVWDPITTGVETVIGAITGGFESAWETVSGIWGGIQDIWGNVKGFFVDTANRGNARRTGDEAAAYANGGLINRPHLGLVGEAGPEMIIPLSSSRRSRAMDLYKKTGEILGLNQQASEDTREETFASPLRNITTPINRPLGSSATPSQDGIEPIPYANGGIIDKPHLGLVGEAGPEAIIPLSSGRRSRALELYEKTGKALGVKPYANGGLVGGRSTAARLGERGPGLVRLPRGAEVFSHDESMDMVSGRSTMTGSHEAEGVMVSTPVRTPVQLPEEQLNVVNYRQSTSATSKGGVRDVNINFTGDQHYHSEMDAEKVGKIATKAIKDVLEEEYLTGGEGVIDD